MLILRNTPWNSCIRLSKIMMSYIGSSDYDTAQMSRLIDLIVQDCKAQGIETLTPDKLDAMKVKWGEAYGGDQICRNRLPCPSCGMK